MRRHTYAAYYEQHCLKRLRGGGWVKTGPRIEGSSHHALSSQGHRLIPTPANTHAIQGTSHRGAWTSYKQKGGGVTVTATSVSIVYLEWVLGGRRCVAEGFYGWDSGEGH